MQLNLIWSVGSAVWAHTDWSDTPLHFSQNFWLVDPRKSSALIGWSKKTDASYWLPHPTDHPSIPSLLSLDLHLLKSFLIRADHPHLRLPQFHSTLAPPIILPPLSPPDILLLHPPLDHLLSKTLLSANTRCVTNPMFSTVNEDIFVTIWGNPDTLITCNLGDKGVLVLHVFHLSQNILRLILTSIMRWHNLTWMKWNFSGDIYGYIRHHDMLSHADEWGDMLSMKCEDVPS